MQSFRLRLAVLNLETPDYERTRNPATKLGVPAWSFFLSKNFRDFEASSLGILVFRGTFRPIWPNFDPVFTNSDLFDLFRRADLACFHPFRPIRQADLTYFHLFRPISFHNQAPWTGHLNETSIREGKEQPRNYEACGRTVRCVSLNVVETVVKRVLTKRANCELEANKNSAQFIGFGRRGLLQKGSLQKSRFSEIQEILENPQTVENKGESDHFLEILENLEILERF